MSIFGAHMKRLLVVTVALVGLAAPLSAAPITGTLNIAGSVQVNSTKIDWYPIAGTEGTFTTTFPGTDYFAGIYNPVDPAISAPYTGNAIDLVMPQAFPLPNFLNDFSAPDPKYDDLSFTLLDVVDPTAPPCTGFEGNNQPCSLGEFTLTQTSTATGTAVTVNFNVLGFFVDLTEGDPGINLATGAYTTQLNTPAVDTIAEVRAIILSGNSVQASYSATYNVNPAVIPEPATLLTFGTGSFLLAAHKRRRAKKQNAA